jgi:hypothetical protein
MYYERTSPIREYIIPGTESEEVCMECRGHGATRCDNCHGRGRVTCSRCGGTGETMENKECPVCRGEGRVDSTSVVRRRMPSGRVSEEEVEIEGECPGCHGIGYREYLARCYVCGGTGREECSDCDGSGETDCPYCEGRGKTYGATISKVQIEREETDTGWLTGPVPSKYMSIARAWYNEEENLAPESRDMVKKQRVRRTVPVAYLKYSLNDKIYSLYEIGYGLKKMRGKLKPDSYPKSLKKFAAFSGSTAFVIAITVVITRLIMG